MTYSAASKPDLFLFRHGKLSLVYRDGGGTGMPLIFQHGLCADSGQTFPLLPAHPGFRPVTLECRGHGSSDIGPEASLSLATFADDLTAFIEQCIGKPVILGGTSMGATIALRLTVQRPDLVCALILVRPAWVTEGAPANLRSYTEIGRLLHYNKPDTAKFIFQKGTTAAGLAAEMPRNSKSLLALFDRQPTLVTAALLRRIAVDAPCICSEQLGEIIIPTLVIGQLADALHPLGHAEALARLIPHANFTVLQAKTASEPRRIECRIAISRFLATLEIPRDT